jgi:hypothetical protein
MSERSVMQLARRPLKDHQARGFLFETSENGRVATIRLNRPERKNPTFESNAELSRGMSGARPSSAFRALRIYEGATEAQKLIVARELLKPR